jgi:hypothetical protein
MEPLTIALSSAVTGLAGAVVFLFKCYQKSQEDRIAEMKARISDSERYERMLDEFRSLLAKKTGGAR